MPEIKEGQKRQSLPTQIKKIFNQYVKNMTII